MISKQSRPPFRKKGSIGLPALIGLLLLLAAPIGALNHLAKWVDWWILVAAPLMISLITFFAYRSDKRRAEAQAWRIPEFTLHVAESFGGWPGAFLAQRQFRHKITKVSYQIEFWLIVLVHQFIAVDFLLNGKFTKQLLHFLKLQHP